MSDEKRFPDDYDDDNPWVALWRWWSPAISDQMLEDSRQSFKEAADAVEREIDPQDA